MFVGPKLRALAAVVMVVPPLVLQEQLGVVRLVL